MSGITEEVKDLLAPLLRARGWMRFLAVVTIASGVLMVFTGWGLLVFWMPIWQGVVLWQAAGALEGLEFGSADVPALRRGFARLRLYFVLQGIFIAVLLAVSAIVMILTLGGIMMGGMMGGMGGPGF